MAYCECTFCAPISNPNICIRICAIAILRQYMLYNPPYQKDFSRQMIITKIWMYVDLLAGCTAHPTDMIFLRTLEVNIAIVLACLVRRRNHFPSPFASPTNLPPKPVIQPLIHRVPFLLPFLPSSFWASWFSSPSAAQKRSWPKKLSA